MYAVKKGHVAAMKLLLNEYTDTLSTDKVPFFHYCCVYEYWKRYQILAIKKNFTYKLHVIASK